MSPNGLFPEDRMEYTYWERNGIYVLRECRRIENMRLASDEKLKDETKVARPRQRWKKKRNQLPGMRTNCMAHFIQPAPPSSCHHISYQSSITNFRRQFFSQIWRIQFAFFYLMPLTVGLRLFFMSLKRFFFS